MAPQDEMPFESDSKLTQLLRDGAKREPLPTASSNLRRAIMDKLNADSIEQAAKRESVSLPTSRKNGSTVGTWIAAIATIAGCGIVALVASGLVSPKKGDFLASRNDDLKSAKAAHFRGEDGDGEGKKVRRENGEMTAMASVAKSAASLKDPVPADTSGYLSFSASEDRLADVEKLVPASSEWAEAKPYAAPAPVTVPLGNTTRGVQLSAGSAAAYGGNAVQDGYARGTPALSKRSGDSLGRQPQDGEARLARLHDSNAAGLAGGGQIVNGKTIEDNLALSEGTRLYAEQQAQREQYAKLIENAPQSPMVAPLSTFGIDVDTASYANVRRFISQGSLPPVDAVRVEELINYFSYNYPQPEGDDPFRVDLELADCPWQEGHWLLRVGLKGKEIEVTKRPASNLVFLVDVSGSMADENKLPLLRQSLAMMVEQLTENDRVSIVTYAGDTSLRLAATSGDQKEKILSVINGLASGGSTNGSAGIVLAYEQAAQGFIKDGTNRVILATDGDLNVGITSDEALVKLIEEKRQGGTFLTVLGFGEGNLQDAKMEGLADHGNGVYAYIDGLREARKVLVEQLTGTLLTIAKDVKIQIEFNPQEIAGYRLIGYENRALAAQDFANDKKDAGDIGAGHTVTALYELTPVGLPDVQAPKQPLEEPLRYQKASAPAKEAVAEESGKQPRDLSEAAKSGELLTVKLRFKKPAADVSELREIVLKEKPKKFGQASSDFQFASSVAGYGMLLRSSPYRGNLTTALVEEVAAANVGKEATGGYRAEFVDLVRKSAPMLPQRVDMTSPKQPAEQQ